MKKIIFAIAIVLTLGLTANAQKNDSFIHNDWDESNRDWDSGTLGIVMPALGIGTYGNSQAPLGTGILVLTALGAGYAVARKKRR